MMPQTSWEEVRQFIGLVDLYHDMWERLSHTVSPLTKLNSGKLKFGWTKIEQDAFEEINRIVDRDNLLAYPYFNEEFKIHTNASDFLLGAVIS